VAVRYEHNYEPTDAISGWERIDALRDYRLFKKKVPTCGVGLTGV